MLLFDIEKDPSVLHSCYISAVNSIATCSAYHLCQLGGGVGLSGWVVCSPFIFLFTFFLTTIMCCYGSCHITLPI